MKNKLSPLFILIALLCAYQPVFAYESLPVLPKHPRLMVTADELPALRKRFVHPDFADMREVFEQQHDYKTDGFVTVDKPNERIRQKMEALALEYLLYPDTKQKSGKEAIVLAKNYLTSYSDLRQTAQKEYDENLQTYEAIFGAALVYDWCYNLLSDDDKQTLIDKMKQVSKLGEYGLRRDVNQYLSGHYGEYAPTVNLAMGIAIADEDAEIMHFAYDEQVNKFAPTRNSMYPSHTHHQGAQYIHVRGSHELMQHFILNKLNISPYSPEIVKMNYRNLYGTIPQKNDMDGMPEGDCHNNVMMKTPQIYYLSANLSGDPFLQILSRKYLKKGEYQSARMFILHNPEIPSADINNLPLTKYFPSPSGIMIARTKWDLDSNNYLSNAMIVLMNMKEYNTQNHTHMDQGHFSIYYKGHQALDAGIYQGKDPDNGWGKTNYVNYYSRTIAHNSLLIFDPNEPTPYAGWKVKSSARDGGQFFYAHHAWDTSKEMFDAGQSAKVLSVDIPAGNAPDYSYMKGDLTPAYNAPKLVGNYPAKVEVVRRSFVFLNHKSDKVPGTLLVLDKIVSTNPDFKKTWLLHTQNEPIIINNSIVAQNTNDGRNGKLITTILLPEIGNQQIEKIGGAGKEYWVDGQNWGTVKQEDAGEWRIELSPKKLQKSDNFLNVIQAMDAINSPKPYTVTKTLSKQGDYVAVKVNDRIVAQNLSLDINTKPIDFTIGDKNKTYKVLITDLESGWWKIKTLNAEKIVEAKDNGTVFFESKGGTFSISRN